MALVLDCLPLRYLSIVRQLCTRRSRTRAAYSAYWCGWQWYAWQDDPEGHLVRFLSESDPRALRKTDVELQHAALLVKCGAVEVTHLRLGGDDQLEVLTHFTALRSLQLVSSSRSAIEPASLPCLEELRIKGGTRLCSALIRAAPSCRSVSLRIKFFDTDLARDLGQLSQLDSLKVESLLAARGKVDWSQFLRLKTLTWFGCRLSLVGSRPPLLRTLCVDKLVFGETGPLESMSFVRPAEDWDLDVPSSLTVLSLRLQGGRPSTKPFRRLTNLTQVSIKFGCKKLVSGVLGLPLLRFLVLDNLNLTIGVRLDTLIDLTLWSQCRELEEAKFVAFYVSAITSKLLADRGPRTLQRLSFVRCVTEHTWSRNAVDMHSELCESRPQEDAWTDDDADLDTFKSDNENENEADSTAYIVSDD